MSAESWAKKKKITNWIWHSKSHSALFCIYSNQKEKLEVNADKPKSLPLTSEENWARCLVTKSRSCWFRSQDRMLMFQERIPAKQRKKRKGIVSCHNICSRNRNGDKVNRTHKDQWCSSKRAYLGQRKSSEAEDHKMLTFHRTSIPEVHAVSKSSFNLGFMQGNLTSYKRLRLTKLPYCLTKQIHC